MNKLNQQTLNLLNQIGMVEGYPMIHHLYIVSRDRYRSVESGFINLGAKSAIDQTLYTKFVLVYSLLDGFIDDNHHLVGENFSDKYKALPEHKEEDKIIKGLFLIATHVRNALTHDPSRINSTADYIEISDRFNHEKIVLKMSNRALRYFYTAVVMLVRGNLGSGAYFLAAISTLYKIICNGVEIHDPNGYTLKTINVPYTINLSRRLILIDPEFSFDPYLRILVDTSKTHHPVDQGLDFTFTLQGEKILIPLEVLNTGLNLSEDDVLTDWKYQGPFPPLEPKNNGINTPLNG